MIPAHATVDGLIDTPGDVTIEGRVQGEVRAGGTVTIAAGATCKAAVLSRSAAIYGELIGNAVCTETIEVCRGARIVGDLRAPNVSVASGCEVDGRVDLLAPEPGTRRLPLPAEAGAESTSEFDDIATREHTRELSELTPTMDVAFRRAVPRMPRPTGRVKMVHRDQ